jgi:ABC-type ATPase with predicted acetyltransferase domain
VKYVINKKFESKVTRSPRVLECAEGFGLGLESKEFVVYENAEIEINAGDIVYITGQSGSGKSIALRELGLQLSATQEVANIDGVVVSEAPLIEQVGHSTDDAIRILSAAGLNDAYLFLRSPSQLSDGQLYRFKIAKLIESEARVWVADEFGAVLDRTTAKVVAFSLQKQARAVGATVIIATTHKDLREELAPNVYMDKSYSEQMKLEYGQ